LGHSESTQSGGAFRGLILGEVIDDEIEKVMLHLQERDSDFEFRGVRGSLILKWLTRLASKESV
jgi:hypothetical protein